MKKLMKVAQLKGIKKIELEELPKPSVGENEILLKIKACSICGSDVRTYNFGHDRVKLPAVIGHEISGVVEQVGSGVTKFQTRDRVCLGADVPSMEDDWSQNGMGNLSDINYAIGHQFPGGFAEYCLLNETTVKFGPLAKIPDDISYEEACLTEPLACCVNGLERCFMEPCKTVLVMGAGPIGIMLAQLAEAFGASKVVISEMDEKRIEQARGLGFKNVVNAEEGNLETVKNDLTNGKGFDVILTACPSVEAHKQSVNLISKRGVINFFGGLPAGSKEVSFLSNAIHYKEAYITGSHGATPRHFKLALDLIVNKRIDVKSLVTHKFPLEKIGEAFETAQSLSGLKVLILPTGK